MIEPPDPCHDTAAVVDLVVEDDGFAVPRSLARAAQDTSHFHLKGKEEGTEEVRRKDVDERTVQIHAQRPSRFSRVQRIAHICHHAQWCKVTTDLYTYLVVT